MDIRPPEPRSAARILVRELTTLGLEIKYTQALNVVAKILGFQSFHALRVHLKGQPLAAPANSDKVFIGTYEHRHGRDVCVYRTYAAAAVARTSIAKEYWAEEIGNDEEMPPEDELADEYFHQMGERELEWFTIEEVELGA